MTATIQKCSKCRFWDITGLDYCCSNGVAQGECKRFPPVYTGNNHQETSSWNRPITLTTDVCGEFVRASDAGIKQQAVVLKWHRKLEKSENL